MAASSQANVTNDESGQAQLALRLYVAPGSPNSERALSNLTALCAQYLPNGCTLEIVDVRKEPLRALADEVLVTPTLLRLFPLPIIRIVGTLSHFGRVLEALGLQPGEQADDDATAK